MTIATLIEKLKELPQDLIVAIEYDGPDTYTELEVNQIVPKLDWGFVVLTNDSTAEGLVK